jgi:hypothetical protein
VGARNALKAYALYAGKLHALPMQVLTYMALVSKDADEYPWFSQGHEALAEFALGRPTPIQRADFGAVERALAALVKAKAITVERKAARRRDEPWTARYRLELDHAQPVDISVMRRQPG